MDLLPSISSCYHSLLMLGSCLLSFETRLRVFTMSHHSEFFTDLTASCNNLAVPYYHMFLNNTNIINVFQDLVQDLKCNLAILCYMFMFNYFILLVLKTPFRFA